MKTNFTQQTISRHVIVSNSLLLIVGLITTMVLFSSCKDETITIADTNSRALDREKLKFALHRNESLTLKERDTWYTISESVDLLNDGLNFLYCRPGEVMFNSLVFKDTVVVPVTAGEIEEEDILDAMENIAVFAGNKYHRNASTTKQPLIFQMQQLTSGSPYSVPIEVTFIMDVDDLPVSSDVYPYEDTWIFGQFYNDVTDVCNTQGVNLDAPDLFRRDLRENVTFRDKNESYYFKDYHIVCFSSASDDCDGFEIPDGLTADEHIQGNALLNPNDVTPGDNFLDYLLFSNYEGIANFHECLSDTEMNFHYESMEELAIAELPSPIGNNVIGQIEVGYNLSLGFYSRYSHNMLVMIAHKLPVSEGYEQADVLPCTECP